MSANLCNKPSCTHFQPKKQNVLHVACSRSSGNSASILRALLAVMPKDARLQKDSVRKDVNITVTLSHTFRDDSTDLVSFQIKSLVINFVFLCRKGIFQYLWP